MKDTPISVDVPGNSVQDRSTLTADHRDPTPRIKSGALLGAAGELVIEHGGRDYKLRITQNGKLILTA